MMVIKEKKPSISKYCTNCFSPTYLKFNFSFITYEKKFEDKYKIALLDRIRELSEHEYLVVSSWDKKKGFETEKINIRTQISSKFYENKNRKYDNKYTIIRLFPNDNPIQARIIGKMINKIFYILFIDIGGKLYKH